VGRRRELRRQARDLVEGLRADDERVVEREREHDDRGDENDVGDRAAPVHQYVTFFSAYRNCTAVSAITSSIRITDCAAEVAELEAVEAVLPRAIHQDGRCVARAALRHRVDEAERLEEREGHVEREQEEGDRRQEGKRDREESSDGPAPSTLAASSTEPGMAWRPAR